MPLIINKKWLFTLCTALVAGAQIGHAIIFPSGDNNKNQTAPDTERTDIFNAIGRSVNSGTGSGSAVYLEGKYVLTANHVNLLSNISFDGVTKWKIDTAFSPKQIAGKDLKVIKLEKTPTAVNPVILNTSSSEFNKDVFIVGWGRGRSTSDNDGSNGWTWGNSSTEAKRWGTNKVSGTFTYPSYNDLNGNTYTNTATLYTLLSSNTDDDEAAAAYLDSGGGMFAKFGNEWRLIGLTILSGNPSVFNNSNPNYFIRISSYASAIQSAIPDTTTFSDWKIDHSLYGGDADNDADTDDDGIEQLLEFALGGDPNDNDSSILPTHDLVEDGDSTYLELTVIRPIGLQDITYTPQTTTDIGSWPKDSTGIVDDDPTPVNNGNGTETLTYRRDLAVSATDEAFIRLEVTESP